MRTFKVGDKVRVRAGIPDTGSEVQYSTLEPPMCNSTTQEMMDLAGSVGTITNRDIDGWYTITADGGRWCWLPEWLEPVMEDDEVGELAEEIEAMVKQLRRKINSSGRSATVSKQMLRKWAQTLEKLVW